jgi:uncharacterized protein involved in response to NO
LARALWVRAAGAPPAGMALIVAGVLQIIRLSRWAEYWTIRKRLVLVLHAGCAFVPVGFLLLAHPCFNKQPIQKVADGVDDPKKGFGLYPNRDTPLTIRSAIV